MNNKIVLNIIGILLLSITSVFAQKVVKTMPHSSEEYYVTLEEHFERIQDKDKKLVKVFFKDLEEKWTTGYFSDEIKEEIYVTSNLMLDHKMRAMPFFYDYFKTLMALMDQDHPNKTVMDWMSSVNVAIKNLKNREFSDYLHNSLALFNKQYLFSNKIIQWKADGSWKLEVDSSIRYVFQMTDLVCYTKKDSSNIYATAGVYYPLERAWQGEGGKIDWQRANLDPNEVYANFRTYKIEMKMSKFIADSVELFNYRYFDKPLNGMLEEQVLASRRGEKALFPSFTSYNKQWKIPEIFEDIDFSGGFKIEGARLIGIGDTQNPVVLQFKRNGEKFITLKSNSFSIMPDRIRSQYASITISYHEDSIYHSGLRMNYSDINRELSLIRDEKGLRADPFFDTFHQLDMFVEAAYWKMDEDVMDFDMVKGMNKRPAFFTSNNRYSQYHFEELMGMDAQHPLSNLKKYVKDNGSNVVHIIDYAKYQKMPYEMVKHQLLTLAHEGFVMYDAAEDKVTVKERTGFYLDARSGKVDYDVIFFKSDSTKLTNAELKLDSFDLRINGVQKITLSDSQNLIIEPGHNGKANDDYIVIGKNRNFRFNGKITAGRFSFRAYGCTFNYNSFKLDMPQIDSLWFWVEGDPLPTGGRERKQVKTALMNLSGDLLIDHPSNKSGLLPYDEYPVFNSKKDSYAYYDHYFIEKGVYTKDRFYFRINPFVLKSLVDVKAENINFDGYLYSGGIFPDIFEPLRVMDDYSLGFFKESPDHGFPTYGDKGLFFNTVSLSNRGLRGDGILDYLKSKTIAVDYVFYLDSMNVHSESFALESSIGAVEYPHVTGSEVYQHWMPYQDEMQIFSKKNPLKMYDEETTLGGMISLKPTGLSGNGRVNFRVAYMQSNLYDFKNMTYHADTVDFVDEGWSLTDFKADADYNERKVVFTSNGGNSLVQFPENMYICYMDEATWFMDQEVTTYSLEDVTLPEELQGKTNRELVDMEINGPEFISIHPGQDSLTFTSSKASFNSRKKEIKALGVALILVADAAVYPSIEGVTILEGAEMLPLIDVEILANTTTKYHEIRNAKVKIKGRNDYSGSGDYLYLNRDGLEQNIFFENIRVDTTLQTVASGSILKEQSFTLSSAFAFYGSAHLLASRKQLEFDGGFKINSSCVSSKSWIAFKTIIDPEDIIIPIPAQPRVPDISNTRKFAGIANSSSKKKVYSLFMQDKIDYFDSILISAHGFITFDYSKSIYKISTKEKLLQYSRPDNYLSFDPSNCKIQAEGLLNIDVRTRDFKIKSYGIVDEKSGKINFKLATAFDFHFSEKAMAEIVNAFKNIEYSGYDLTTEYYSKVAGGFMGIDMADQYISKILMGQQKRIPEQLQHTIFINEMNLTWVPALNSYISKGKISIGGFFKTRINGEVKGHVEFHKVRSGDEINIYFEVGSDWFYFNYQNSVLRVFSSVAKFNELVMEDVVGKGNKNELKEQTDGDKKSTYRYNITTSRKKDDFLTRIKPFI